MTNTSILSNIALLHSLLVNNVHLVVTVGVALLVLLWLLAVFEKDRIMTVVLRLRHRQRQEQLTPVLGNRTITEAAEPKTPQATRPFARLNPIQSVEREQRKRSQSAAAVAAANEATSTPRLRQNFKRLNPNQSIERYRRMHNAV